MGFGFFQGTKIKILNDILNLNDAAEIDGSAISANKVMVADANKSVKSSSVSTTELGYLTGVTGNIQSQINSATSGTIPVGDLTVSGNLGVTGNGSITGTLSVTGISEFKSGISVTGLSSFTSLSATSVSVNGSGTFTGLTVNGNEAITGTLSVTGLSTLGTLSAGNGTLTGLTVNGNETVTGTLGVTGAASFGSNITVGNELRLEDPDSGTNYVAFKASTAQAANHTYTVPTAQPTSDGQVLSSTTAGSMSWTTVPTAAPYDVSNTTFTVSASITNTILIFNAAVNSAHIFWSLHNGVADAHQAGNSIVLKKNSSYEISNVFAGSATFGGVNLTITTGGALQLDNPSVSGTLYYRILTT